MNIPTVPSSPDPTDFMISARERAAAYLMILALCGGVAGALAAWLVLSRLDLAGLILGLAVVVSAVCLLYLTRRYRAQPVLHRLQSLDQRAQYIAKELRELQGYLSELHNHRDVLDSERRVQIETLKPAYREKSADLNELFLGIDQRERDEVNAALETYQEAFTRSAIAEASIRRVRVPGFTSRVLERLEEAGILTAVDITTERLRAIPNLDPFLIQELDLWRQRIERDAEARKPLSLPAVRLDPIHRRYQEERMAVKASIEGLVLGMQNEVVKIENRIGERVVQTNALEENLGSRIKGLGKLYHDLRQRIHPLRFYTFRRFFFACLGMSR